MCMVAGLLYNLISISQLFFSYKVDVTISLLHVNELTFPAITICNMSPVKKSAFEGNLRRRRKRRSVGKLWYFCFYVIYESCHSQTLLEATHNTMTTQIRVVARVAFQQRLWMKQTTWRPRVRRVRHLLWTAAPTLTPPRHPPRPLHRLSCNHNPSMEANIRNVSSLGRISWRRSI